MKAPNTRPTPKIKSGHERFNVHGDSTGFKLLDYWKWSASDLLSNTQRGVLAEFLVAEAMGLVDLPRLEWGWYDLVTIDKKTIEVKSAAYYQSWSQNKPSEIRFDIAPRKLFWDPITNDYHEYTESTRRSDAYVFCLLGDRTESNPNPLDLDQWSFYVINTGSLNRSVPLQKSIGIQPLMQLVKKETGRCEVKYPELSHEISIQLLYLNNHT